VNGPAVTGGFELALNCDFLVASELAKFGDSHARVGVVPAWGMSVLLPQAIGVRRARELSFTGNFIDAAEALALGLVNHVVPHRELIPATRRLANDIAGNDQQAVRQIRTTYAAITHDDDAWETEARAARAWQRTQFSADQVAARRAAVIKRGREQ
jgi:enoyl-CoA hydratase/carnithine racemase